MGLNMINIDFRTAPHDYKHWNISFSGSIATLVLDVDEEESSSRGYRLKLNSYDLSVDIELNDAIQRLRFEHPSVHCVILTSAKQNVFCAGANIGMLSTASHSSKVNFCKFTNETRLAIEDASRNSGQIYFCAINGSCAGGGYELALATDHIAIIDDGATSVSLPEVPLLGVLPGTGGLTRLVDKRQVRKDHADYFCTIEEGIRGQRAVEWNLVDELIPRSFWKEAVSARAKKLTEQSDRPIEAEGIELTPLNRNLSDNLIEYTYVKCMIDTVLMAAHITVHAPFSAPPEDLESIHREGANFWLLAMTRELEDLILHLRFNCSNIGTWLLYTEGQSKFVESVDKILVDHSKNWFIQEMILYTKRTFKRLDLSARSMFALIKPGSCFSGTLLELALCADRIYMLDGIFENQNEPAATILVTTANQGCYPMGNGLTRIDVRFLNNTSALSSIKKQIGKHLKAQEAMALGLITFAPDDIDWEDETRMAIEERAAFSPDALSGMEASLRFAGPETMETKIFSRLSAWQNWVFQRPNAVGEKGTLTLYGSGKRPDFDVERV